MQTDNGRTETIKIEGKDVLDQLRDLIHEGNVRHVTVRHDGHVVAEFPLTVGVAGTILAPVVAAIGAMGALLTGCTVEVVREKEPGPLDQL
jgi:sorbitol-specific phosphotransferase system component IIA